MYTSGTLNCCQYCSLALLRRDINQMLFPMNLMMIQTVMFAQGSWLAHLITRSDIIAACPTHHRHPGIPRCSDAQITINKKKHRIAPGHTTRCTQMHLAITIFWLFLATDQGIFLAALSNWKTLTILGAFNDWSWSI